MAENPSVEAPPEDENTFNVYYSRPSILHESFSVSISVITITCYCLLLLTRGSDAVYESLHLFVTLGLVCIEVCTSTGDPPTPVPELAMGLVLLLTMIH